MDPVAFPNGWPYLIAPATGTFKFLLLKTSAPTPDPASHTYISALSAYEPTTGTYARQTATSGLATVYTGDPPSLACDFADPSWASSGGEVVGWLVLARVVTTDANSPLCAAWRVSHTLDGTTWSPRISSTGVTKFTGAV